MLFTYALLIIPVGFLISYTQASVDSGKVPSNPTSSACSHAASIEKFAAAFYTAMVIVHDPEIVYGLQLPGHVAGKRLNPVLTGILTKAGLTNAKCVASTAQRAVSVEKIFRLPVYFEKAIYCIGDFLLQEGVLNCSNAIDLAIEYFGFTQKVFQPLDKTKVESYMTAVCQGLVDFLVSREVNLEDSEENWEDLANLFYLEYFNHRTI